MDEEAFDYMRKFLQYGYNIGFLPYKLVTTRTTDEETGIVTETRRWVYEKSLLRFLYFCYSYLILGLYEVFLVFRTTESYLDENESVKATLSTCYVSGAFIIINFFHWVNIRYYGQHCDFYNLVVNTVNMLSEGQSQNPEEEEKTPQKLDDKNGKPNSKSGSITWIYRIFAVFIPFPGLMRALSVFKAPHTKYLVTSLFVTSPLNSLSLWVKIIGGVIHFHVTLLIAFELFFQVSTPFWFEASVNPVIRRLRVKSNDGRPAASDERLYHFYHCLHILQKYANEMYSIVPLGAEAAAIFICVINIFMGVVHREYSAFIRAAAMGLLARILFTNLAQIYEESETAIESWKLKSRQGFSRSNDWFQKFQKSCRPLRVSIGGLFYVDKPFYLTLIGIIINNSTNLIISYK